MIISYKLLQSYFVSPLPKPEKLAEALTFHAFEIEEIVKVKGDIVIDLKVLPNRAHDCLSHEGVAREVSAILEIPLKRIPVAKLPRPSAQVQKLSVTIRDSRAHRYSGVIIQGVKVGPSPKWLRDTLEALGQRSINNIVDATNYIMFRTGQPLHAFDQAKVAGNAIIVRPAKETETLTTLDGKYVALDPSIMVIADKEAPLALAGIKGGTRAEVDAATSAIIIESANFDASTIRMTAQRLGIKTDASKRFESGRTSEATLPALFEVAALILSIAGGASTRVGAVADIYPKKERPITLSVAVNDINRILGTDFSASEVARVWKRLGIPAKMERSKDVACYQLSIPAARLDLRIVEDLAEEVGRLMGYHRLTPTLPVETSGTPVVAREWRVRDLMRALLVGAGFSEVYTYAFMGKGEVEVANPIAADKKYLRNTLMTGLKNAVAENLKHTPEVRIFEFGHIFGREKGILVEESSFAICMGFHKRKEAEQKRDFFVLKGLVEAIAQELGVADVHFEEAGGELVASIMIGNEVLGTMTLNGLELDMSLLVSHVDDRIIFQMPSRYPSVVRDVSLFVPLETRAREVEMVIRNVMGPLVRSLTLIDVFEQPEQSRKSFAFRMLLQSDERTLSDDEANSVSDRVVDALRMAQSSWQVRA